MVEKEKEGSMMMAEGANPPAEGTDAVRMSLRAEALRVKAVSLRFNLDAEIVRLDDVIHGIGMDETKKRACITKSELCKAKDILVQTQGNLRQVSSYCAAAFARTLLPINF